MRFPYRLAPAGRADTDEPLESGRVITNDRVKEIQREMEECGVEAWLLFNFRDTNPIACDLLGITSEIHQTRRWVVLVPVQGSPISLCHAIETHLSQFLPGRNRLYHSIAQFREYLKEMVSRYDCVAMEYSPMNGIPTVAKVDAGTVELVRSFGTEVVSSGALIARLGGRLTEAQVESAKRAGERCRAIMGSAFQYIAISLDEGVKITEYDVVRYIEARLAEQNLDPEFSPICAVGENSANPHYSPVPQSATTIERGQLVLIDLWGKSGEEGVFGDITWTGYTGDEVPEKYTSVFQIVRKARDAALSLIEGRFAKGIEVTGAEADSASREVLEREGLGAYVLHRTGHSITNELHGPGTNLDSLESFDDRPILRSTSFSIEPGVYIPGEFGIRVEIDVVIDAEGVVHVTSSPAQEEVLPLFRAGLFEQKGFGVTA